MIQVTKQVFELRNLMLAQYKFIFVCLSKIFLKNILMVHCCTHTKKYEKIYFSPSNKSVDMTSKICHTPGIHITYIGLGLLVDVGIESLPE